MRWRGRRPAAWSDPLRGDSSSPPSCSRPVSRTACPRSTAGARASTRWKAAATTSIGATDFELVQQMGIGYLRYRTADPHDLDWATGKYDWAFADRDVRGSEAAGTSYRSWTSATSASRTGSATSRTPDFLSDLFCRLRAGDFATALTPGCRLYTPVNEMYICAHLLRTLRLVERAAQQRPGRSSPRSSIS